MLLDRPATAKGYLNRRDAAVHHALERFRMRCGTTLDFDDYRFLCEHIRRGGLAPCAFCDDGAPVFEVTIKGVVAYAIWSVDDELVRTFLNHLGYRQAAQLIEGVSVIA